MLGLVPVYTFLRAMIIYYTSLILSTSLVCLQAVMRLLTLLICDNSFDTAFILSLVLLRMQSSATLSTMKIAHYIGVFFLLEFVIGSLKLRYFHGAPFLS